MDSCRPSRQTLVVQLGRKSARVESVELNAAPSHPLQVLLGDMGAGKSSLVLRFVKGQFFDYQASGQPCETSASAAPSN